MLRLLPAIFILSIILQSCFSYTRMEEDVYTRTTRDTTYVNYVHKDPRNQDNGVVKPSKRVILNERKQVLEDSVVQREYPDFIRIGLFEAAGLFGGNADFGMKAGLFGVHPNPFAALDESFRGEKSTVPGGLYRLFIFEKRLRWFRDAPNWTFGITGFEMWAPDSRLENALIATPAMHFRWRYYLSEKIPYNSIMLGTTMGFFPSMYFGLEAQYELGSIGGLNARAYLGYNFGFNPSGGVLDRVNEFSTGTQNPTMFYFGLGISYLDFKNIVPETYKETKDMEHSAWNIGLVQSTLLTTSGNNRSFLALNDADPTADSFIKGGIFRFVNTSIALPIWNNQLYAGTSLLNLALLGATEGGISFLPIRVGYMQTVLKDNLIFEPFFEYNYYPSSFIHTGGKLNLTLHEVISDRYNIGLAFGYMSGNFFGGLGKDQLTQYDLGDFSGFGEFSKFYFGINIGILDRIFYPHELRYNKKEKK